MDRPLVSVIIPAYNVEKTIEQCVQSVFSQTIENLEIIVVDDGSTDNTGAVLDRMAEADGRLKVIHQPNAGASTARNRGLEESCGKYIRFVDADDRLTKNGIQVMIDALEKDKSEMVFAAYVCVIGNKRKDKNLYKKREAVPIEKALQHMNPRTNSFYYGVLWNKLFIGDIIRRHDIRFYPHQKQGEDFTFVCRYMQHVNTVSYICDEVYEYQKNGDGLTMQHCMDCVWHPIANCKLKKFMYDHLKALYVKKGVYHQYRHSLWLYLFRITLTN